MVISKLIVNADDFGISQPVNRAIFESIESGFVTSTSIMANMPGFEDAIDLAREHALLNGRIGAHLNLTEGRPLSSPILSCPRFCDKDGRLAHNRKEPLFRLSRREKRAVYEELKAQMQRILAAGVNPVHVDSHHHVHTEWAIAPLVCRVGREYGIPRIRLTRNIGSSPGIAKRIYKTVFNKWMLGHWPRNTDYFGDIGDMAFSSGKINLEGKSVEIMVHPLYNEKGEIVDLDGQNLFKRLRSLLEESPLSFTH